ncbi:MAG: PD-(D/E)XK nuclease family protein [Spirochaetota bacterium]
MSYSKGLFPTIRQHLSSPNVIFVFPSEITASFWRRETARRGPSRAVRTDRFISWDTFKEHVLQERAELVPVNRTARMLFAASVVRDNAQTPFLSRLVPREFAEEADSFISEIEGILPTLDTLAAASIRARLEPGLRSDVDELMRRYRRFLEGHRLFEPAWEVGEFDPGRRSYMIIYSKLITDFEEFRAGLEGHPAVTVVQASEEHWPVLREYETSPAEIRDVCAHIEKLLDEGVAPDEIAVSVCGDDAFGRYFEDACRRRGIPVTPRAGKALSAYPAGRFFENLRALAQNSFSLSAMQALLLDGAVPWKEPAVQRSLVQTGIAGGCLRNYRENGRERDTWLRALAGETLDGERRLYKKLRSHTAALSAARGFRELRTALYEFFNVFLDTGVWSEAQMPVFQRCMEVLAELMDTGERLGLGEAKPFDLWLSVLRSRVYVPRGDRELDAVAAEGRDTGGGVAVFPYRVAAGMEPSYHFVVNASNARMRLVYTPFRFLRDDEKATLNLADRDFTDAYTAVYAHSGRHVLVSYARESYSGPQLPPSWFAERQLVQVVGDEETEADPFRLERSYFDGTSGAPQRVYATQRQGVSRMAESTSRPRHPDWSRAKVGDTALRERLLRNRRTKDGELKLSPSDVHTYRHCPFSYMLGRLLELDPHAYQVSAKEAMDAGRAYHRGLENLFARIRRHSTVFRAEDAELYHGWVREEAIEAMETWSSTQTSLSPGATVPLRLQLEESMHEMIRADAEQFDGFEIEVLERYESVELEDGVQLGGYMDRRMRRPGTEEAVVIDYKKGNLPEKKTFRVGAREAGAGAGGDVGAGAGAGADVGAGAGAGAGEVENLQLPLYAEILERIGRKVSGLRLYSIEKQKYLIVYAPDEDVPNGGKRTRVLDEEGLAEAQAAAVRAAEASSSGIRAGDFRFPDAHEGCESCAFPGICRAKFMTG